MKDIFSRECRATQQQHHKDILHIFIIHRPIIETVLHIENGAATESEAQCWKIYILGKKRDSLPRASATFL